MRFAFLGSGSRGNALLVERGSTCLLVDCGFSLRELERRLGRLGYAAERLSAVLVTHEHSDHIRGVARLAQRHRIPVWTTAGTHRAGLADQPVDLHVFDPEAPFAIGDLGVRPFVVPHDAEEPTQFVFDDGARRLGLLTDAGSSTPHIQAALDGVQALILECNHEPELLAAGPYPPSLKRRVAGRFGHLSNQQAAALLQSLEGSRLQHLVAAHLSDKNNTPCRARAALAGAIGCTPDWVQIADQEAGLGWCQIS